MKFRCDGYFEKIGKIMTIIGLVITILLYIGLIALEIYLKFFEPFFSIIFIFIIVALLIELYRKDYCYIYLDNDYIEYNSYTHYNPYARTRWHFIEKVKNLNYQIKYSDIKEWGNIKYLSKKFYNNKVWNIGFITKNNKKYYIKAYDFSYETLTKIVEMLNKNIKIAPIKPIKIDKNSLRCE